MASEPLPSAVDDRGKILLPKSAFFCVIRSFCGAQQFARQNFSLSARDEYWSSPARVRFLLILLAMDHARFGDSDYLNLPPR